MKVIALSAWKNSGKDMLTDYLVQKYNAKRVAFADPLKKMVSEEYQIPLSWMDDPTKKETPLKQYPVETKDAFGENIHKFMEKEFRTIEGSGKLYWTPRALCILKGSSNRAVKSSYWVSKAINLINSKSSDTNLVVVSDLRYKSELAQLSEAFNGDVVFVRVNRFKCSPSFDPSEMDLNDQQFDFYVENTTTKENAFLQMDEIVGRIL